MKTQQRPQNGLVTVSGVHYRRSQFTARRSPSIGDWLLFALIMVGIGISVLLVIVVTLGLVWAGLELVGAIARTVRELW